MKQAPIIIKNKRASHDYEFIETYTAGMVLTGTEIKSIRNNAVNLKDSFCKIDDNELFLYNCHISPYDKGNRYNHEEKRTRKLLLTKKEILKISQKIKKDGYTVIPLELFFVQGLAKLEIGLAKGKKLYDKRDDIAKKEQKRDIERLTKNKY